MNNSIFKHYNFVNTPITTVYKEAVHSSITMQDGLASYPVGEYIFQSIFLRATGFQEQKLRCLIWDLATFDYGLRYELTSGKKKLLSSQMSNLSDKNSLLKIFEELLDDIHLIFDDDFCKMLLEETKTEILDIFSDKPLIASQYKSYRKLEEYRPDILQLMSCYDTKTKSRKFKSELVRGQLKEDYESMYRWRNRIAHNTLSYQFSHLTLGEYRQIENGIERDYFQWLYILYFIDKIFMVLYEKFCTKINLDLREKHWIN